MDIEAVRNTLEQASLASMFVLASSWVPLRWAGSKAARTGVLAAT